MIPVVFQQMAAEVGMATEVGPPLTLPIYEFPEPGTPEAERLKRASAQFKAAQEKEETQSDSAQRDAASPGE